MSTGLKPDKEPRRELEKQLSIERTTRQWFSNHRGPCTRNFRINKHLGAYGVMTPCRIQDPEGAKTVAVSFKTTAGAIIAVHRQTSKIFCFRNMDNGRLRVDTAAIIGGKQDMRKHGRRVILIYKSHMYNEATLDPERCTHTSDEKARRAWLVAHIRQIDLYEDIHSQTREQQEDDVMEEEEIDTGQHHNTKIPPNGSGAHTHIAGRAATAAAAGTTTTGVHIPTVVTHLRFGTP